MRWFYFALILCVASAVSAGGYVYRETSALESFCSAVPLGASVVEVRKSAKLQGFDSTMEPFTQMRIQPRYWHLSPPSCRVFFSLDRTVEYRISQAR